ncbi:MAG: hypothetical protein ACSLFK_07370 [Gemmatimonadaceae bacterium]
MLRHLPYYEVLGNAHEGLSIWAPTLAGLTVLELVDAARDDRTIIDRDWTGVRAAADSVAALREGLPVRRHLMTVVDQLRDGGPSWTNINASLFAYGRGLDLDGNWSLAVAVFGMVADIAREERDPKLAIEATTALGGAARRSGDWDRSADSYAQAAHLADTLGDKASGLTVRVGTANTHIARGDLPAARQILDEVIAESDGLDGVQALAYHARASVAHLQGEYATTVSLANRALEKTSNPTVKDSIIADIAAAFAEMGLWDAARDSHMVIALTSRYQWVRWQATINLMELAALDGMEEAFFSYGKELKNAALDPRLRSYFLLYYGQGLLAFGRDDEALEMIAEARDFAAQHKIHQVSHEASLALGAGSRDAARRKASKPWAPDEIPSHVFEVAEVMSNLRESALALPLPGDWYQGQSEF